MYYSQTLNQNHVLSFQRVLLSIFYGSCFFFFFFFDFLLHSFILILLALNCSVCLPFRSVCVVDHKLVCQSGLRNGFRLQPSSSTSWRMYPVRAVFKTLAFVSHSNSPTSKTVFSQIHLHVYRLNLETWVDVKWLEVHRVTKSYIELQNQAIYWLLRQSGHREPFYPWILQLRLLYHKDQLG